MNTKMIEWNDSKVTRFILKDSCICRVDEQTVALWHRGYKHTSTRMRLNSIARFHGLPFRVDVNKGGDWVVHTTKGVILWYEGMEIERNAE